MTTSTDTNDANGLCNSLKSIHLLTKQRPITVSSKRNNWVFIYYLSLPLSRLLSDLLPFVMILLGSSLLRDIPSPLISFPFSDSVSSISAMINFFSNSRGNFPSDLFILFWSFSVFPAGVMVLLVLSPLLDFSSRPSFSLPWSSPIVGVWFRISSGGGSSLLPVSLEPFSCSKKRTCTTVLRGSRSFFTAWARTSGDNFWQSRIRQRRFLSALLRSGCSCLSIETHCECVRNEISELKLPWT